MEIKKIYLENNICRCSKKREEKYANHFKVGHHPFQFVLDLDLHCAEIENAELYTEIITSPCYAEKLFHAGFFISKFSAKKRKSAFSDVGLTSAKVK